MFWSALLCSALRCCVLLCSAVLCCVLALHLELTCVHISLMLVHLSGLLGLRSLRLRERERRKDEIHTLEKKPHESCDIVCLQESTRKGITSCHCGSCGDSHRVDMFWDGLFLVMSKLVGLFFCTLEQAIYNLALQLVTKSRILDVITSNQIPLLVSCERHLTRNVRVVAGLPLRDWEFSLAIFTWWNLKR